MWAIVTGSLLAGLIVGIATGRWYSLAAVAVVAAITVCGNWDTLKPSVTSGDR